MIKTFIIGTGYLSNNLQKKIKNSSVYSAKEFNTKLKKINKKKEKFNLIINSFYSSRKLNNLVIFKEFVEKSLLEISLILDNLNIKTLNKIIYTSSSSVYGSIDNKILNGDKNNRFIYGSFKISAEALLKNFCTNKKIKLDICRIFNLYGKEDGFSIISKIKKHRNKNFRIKIFNKGESVRDFIHVDDVVKIYQKLLKSNSSNIYDLGTGKGLKIIELIKGLKIPNDKINFSNNKNFEITASIANIKKLKKILNSYKFKNVENFLNIKKKLNFENKFIENYLDRQLNGSIIYGAGYSGIRLANQMYKIDRNSISFFVDDDKNKIGKFINKIKVLSFKNLKYLSQFHNIRNIILAIPSLGSGKKLNLIKKLIPISNTISSLPSKIYFKNKAISLDDLNEISYLDIFNKKNKFTNSKNFTQFKNKNILITGGAGSIGSEICRQLLRSNPKKIIILDHSELNIYKFDQKIKDRKINLVLGDIKDTELLNKIISKHNINFLFHAAAYKHVKYLETNLHSAIRNNIVGTQSILNSIKERKIKLVFISTDKAVEPKNVLGMTKRVGELLIYQAFLGNKYRNADYSIVRFGNVIGSDGSALPYFLKQIKNDETISLTDIKMERYFMSISEACNLVLQSSIIKSKNKILFLDMGKPLKIINIIKEILLNYGYPNQKLKINIVGNKYNEKITELLTFKDKVYKTNISKIFSINEKKFKENNLRNFLIELNNKIYDKNSSYLINFISKFLIKNK